ncbi:MAG TPA: type I-E CRISPR-associated protein Cas7/Cse4/CasC [Alphaproteobacteria bacterium]|nr:type I-E CRISPR-associated protein Cas7/Cse4/CasC [Alphaproteobacteria bacterium]
MPDHALPAPAAADLIQFHVLTAFPPHNVNRDEDGRPKTCLLGGTLRGRISSQAKKRALRFAPHFPAQRRAMRTREAGIKCFRDLVAAGIDPVSAAWAALAVNFATGGGGSAPKIEDAQKIAAPDAKPGKKSKAGGGVPDDASAIPAGLEEALRTGQGLVISTREFARLDAATQRLAAAWKTDAAGFGAVLEDWVRDICRNGLLGKDEHDLDTALFGRMVAADADHNVEAACAVGHAFTTHEFVPEGDYFSAGEELNVVGGTGAALTSYGFFGGGVYYQHAVLDRRQLRETLAAGRSADEAAKLEEEAVAAFLEGLLFAQPRGKRNSHASDVGASYVLVSRGGDPALNLGLAFLQPVGPKEGSDPLDASIKRLRQFHDTFRSAYGLGNRLCAFNAHPPARGNAPAADEVWEVGALRRFVLEPAA